MDSLKNRTCIPLYQTSTSFCNFFEKWQFFIDQKVKISDISSSRLIIRNVLKSFQFFNRIFECLTTIFVVFQAHSMLYEVFLS